MPAEDPNDDVLLGRTLAETAHLNSPGRRAAEAARNGVRRSSRPSATAQRRSARLFGVGLVVMIAAIAIVAGLAVLLRPHLAP